MGAATWKVLVEYTDGTSHGFTTMYPGDLQIMDDEWPDVAEIHIKRVGSD